MSEIFLQIAAVLLIVLGVSFVMRILKQPLIIGYIVSGIFIGPIVLDLLPQNETIATFSEFGIALLLFIVGLHLSPRVIKEVGKISLITGVSQVVFTSMIGYLIGVSLGLPRITALYVAIALTFSSTIIIMKLLSDKEGINKLYGKISIGFLLVQDLIAVSILIIDSSFSQGGDVASVLTGIVIRGIIAFAILIPTSIFVLPRLSGFFAKSKELLFLFAIVWGIGLAAVFSLIGFSIEVGALIAGVLLSVSPYSYEITSKLKPLRDFFIISFFLVLGSQMTFSNLSQYAAPIIIFSLLIIIGNPLIVMILMGYFGYSRNTGFMAGLTVAQIGEFSLIFIALGVKMGHISNEILSFITIIVLITVASSTYLIMYSDKIYPKVAKYLGIFERKRIKEEEAVKEEYGYILFGENRIGFSIMKLFIKQKKNYLIVDHNPVRVKKLDAKGIPCIYGDISSSEFLEEIRIDKVKLIVSTVPEIEANLLLLRKIREKNKRTIVIVTANQVLEVFKLYEAGADFVILPHSLGGEYTANIIEKAGDNQKVYQLEKKRQIKDLKERLNT